MIFLVFFVFHSLHFSMFFFCLFFFNVFYTPIIKKTMMLSKIPLKHEVNTRLLGTSVNWEKNIGFSMCIVALYVKALEHILNNLEFLRACANFLKPACYVNLWQIFMLCCRFNGFEWFLTFFNKIPFLRSKYIMQK